MYRPFKIHSSVRHDRLVCQATEAGRTRRLFAWAVAALIAVGCHICAADSASAAKLNPSLLNVPTTKVLAIGTFTAKATPKMWLPIVPEEARKTAALYFNGSIDQWYVKQDKTGVVFLLNVKDVEAAHALLDPLPMGKAGVMEFELIPLGPISPLRMILTDN